MADKPDVLAEVCAALLDGNREQAAAILESEYPFEPVQKSSRSYTANQMTRIFVRDGFIDRYSGGRLVFPAALRLISRALPNRFPYHPNWKMSETHVAYWELCPTIDHIVPVSRGGKDAPSNWVCTSMLRNGIKANWRLEELGWELVDAGDISEWDGLIKWFLHYTDSCDELLDKSSYLRRWRRAALNHAV